MNDLSSNLQRKNTQKTSKKNVEFFEIRTSQRHYDRNLLRNFVFSTLLDNVRDSGTLAPDQEAEVATSNSQVSAGKPMVLGFLELAEPPATKIVPSRSGEHFPAPSRTARVRPYAAFIFKEVV